MFIMMLVYILFTFFFFFFGGGGTMSCLYCSWVALLRTLSFFLWGIFFENHGSGLGPALFRLGTRVSPVMQKDFDLSWKFFQLVGENWGLKLVKP
jgi:hypothetical protein